MPTLIEKNSLVSNNPKIDTKDIQQYVAVQFIIQLLKYKQDKAQPNIHDRILLVKGLTGSGKTTILPVEINRAFFNSNPNIPELSKEYRNQIDFNFSAYDFPDDKYSIKNRQQGILSQPRETNTILCAQPTTILAKAKAQEITDKQYNPDMDLAVNVGYNTGTFKLFPKVPNGIIYCTMGTLASILQSKVGHDDEIIQRYSYIMVDECHEQSMEMIRGLLYLIVFLRRNAGNPLCPMVILMSATFDIKKYAGYFGTSPANSIIVEGGVSTRDIFYLDKPSFDIYSDIAAKVMSLHQENINDPDNYCDILVFLPGDGEINKTQKMIEKIEGSKDLYIGKITSEINQKGGPEVDYLTKFKLSELQEELKRPNIKRRVILATSVVETGLTIATLKYCIDSCLAKYVIYFPIHNCSGLLVEQMAKSAAEQRAGRVGRVAHGLVYRMMEENLMKDLDEYKRTDLYTTDIAKMVLDTMYIDVSAQKNKLLDNSQFPDFVEKCLDPVKCSDPCKNVYLYKRSKNNTQKLFDINEINLYPYKLLDLVPTDVFIQARNKLYGLGFWGTYSGYIASKISRLSVESIRMILCGFAYNASINDLITIGLFVDSGQKTYRYTAMNKPKNIPGIEVYDVRKLLKNIIDKENLPNMLGSIDDFHDELYDEFIEPLIITRWLTNNLRKYGPSEMVKKGKKYGINMFKLNKILEPRNQIQKQFRKLGYTNITSDINFNSPDVVDQILRIKKCIHAGFKHNIAYLDKDGIHYKTATGLKILTPDMKIRNKPAKIIFSSLFTTMSSMEPVYNPVAIYASSLSGLF
jgi:hypothetical protein